MISYMIEMICFSVALVFRKEGRNKEDKDISRFLKKKHTSVVIVFNLAFLKYTTSYFSRSEESIYFRSKEIEPNIIYHPTTSET